MTDPLRVVTSLEERGRTPSQARLRRRFLRFVPVRPGDRVLEVGCGSGVVLRDLAAMVGPRGLAVGVDASRVAVRVARALGREHGLDERMTLRVGSAERLPYRSGRFDATVAVTVLLHLAAPRRAVMEMMRVTRPGGRVAVQDQDFGTLAVTHPDRELTARILGGVAERVYEEPWSGRRLPGLLRAVGLERVRLLTDVYQDLGLEPYSRTFLERRAENAVRFGLVDAPTAQRWLDGFTRLVRDKAFLLSLNYYGAVGVRPAGMSR